MASPPSDGADPGAPPAASSPAKPLCPDGAQDSLLEPGPDGGLPGVVVQVPEAPTPAESLPGQFVIRGCRYVPPVVALLRGATLEVSNEDSWLQTAHLRVFKDPKAKGRTVQNLALPPKQPPLSWQARIPGQLSVASDQHAWMGAWLYVAGAGQVTVTDAEGRFQLPGLPPGEWTVRLWHPHLGPRSEIVVVPEDGPAALYLDWEAEAP